MPIQATEKIWHNGKWINWDDAKLHVLSHVVSYGSAVFEGIRCYETKQGPAIFRLREHMQRLINSAKIYRMELPFSLDDFSNAACELVRHNKLNACYVKPIVLPPPSAIFAEFLSAPAWYLGHAWYTLLMTVGGFALRFSFSAILCARCSRSWSYAFFARRSSAFRRLG